MKAQMGFILLTSLVLLNCFKAQGKNLRKKTNWAKVLFKDPWRKLTKEFMPRNQFRYSDEADSSSESDSEDIISSSFEKKLKTRPPGIIGGELPEAYDMPLAIKAFMSFVRRSGCNNVTAYRKFMSNYKRANEAKQFIGPGADDPILTPMSVIADLEQTELNRRCPEFSQQTCKA